MSTDLEVGKVAGYLSVLLVKGDIFVAIMRNYVSGVPSPWAATPMLTLGPKQYTMNLSEDGTLATVVVSAEDVTEIFESRNKTAELNVGQVETWRGKIYFS